MLREQIETGKTVEQAIEAACGKLGLSSDEVQYEVLELPKKGFLGFGASMAKVRVYKEYSKSARAVEYLKEVLAAMGFSNVEIDVKDEEQGALLTLSGEGLGVVIGRRGETLDALQYLSGLVANKMEGDYFRITLDSGNYREKREKTLEELAKKLANNAVRTGRSSTLEPMNPYERRIIHAAVQQVPGATSSSIGGEPNRRIVISSTNPRRPSGGRGRSRDGGEGGRHSRYGERRGYWKDNQSTASEESKPLPDQEDSIQKPGESGAARANINEDKDKPLYSKIEL